ncbi:MAG TPA: YihY/virulence factor BrkB family protein [Acidimicrobiia bacterium]|nr:YihY/virulence factor BrkB family protein [Acidimicrobiia bacterium]
MAKIKEHAVALFGRAREAGLSLPAAAVSYNAFLALVPLVLALLGVASMIGQSEAAVVRVERALEPVVPGSVVQFIVDLMRESGDRVGGSGPVLIVVSALVALFLGSRAVVALQRAVASVDHQSEARQGVSIRLTAAALTVAGGLALLITSVLLVAGRETFAFLAHLTGFSPLDELWAWLRVPVSALGLFAFLIAFYHFGPPRPLDRSWIAALVATVVAVLGSVGFGLYLSLSPDLGPTFGTLGAVAVALVWMYVGAMAILLGAVVATYVRDEMASPHPQLEIQADGS